MVNWVFRGSYFRLYFVIGQKDIQVLYHIQEVLGFGKVNVYPDKEYGRFVVMGF